MVLSWSEQHNVHSPPLAPVVTPVFADAALALTVIWKSVGMESATSVVAPTVRGAGICHCAGERKEEVGGRQEWTRRESGDGWPATAEWLKLAE